MSDKFTAVMDNDYFTTSEKYWKVTVECNDLNTLNQVCSVLNWLREKED